MRESATKEKKREKQDHEFDDLGSVLCDILRLGRLQIVLHIAVRVNWRSLRNMQQHQRINQKRESSKREILREGKVIRICFGARTRSKKPKKKGVCL